VLVYLMRHGTAVDRADPACPPDPARPLTSEGRRRTSAAAKGLAAFGVVPVQIWTSPYLRAKETADIVREMLRAPLPPIETEALLPGAAPERIQSELRQARLDSVLCVGHLPHLDRLIAFLLGAARDVSALKKAGVACLEWPPRGHATLLWLATPRLLRKLHS
jgi:phosphohistidine phosphatase